MTEVFFQEGASEDMGIFAGYGGGWYFVFEGEEYGPYLSKDDADDALEAVVEA